MVVGESFPKGFWMLEGTSSQTDYSGYKRTGLSPSATTHGPALVNGAAKSLIVSNASLFLCAAPVLVKGKEHMPFSIEAHVAPVFSSTTISEQQVFGRVGAMDGLIIEGSVVSFVTKFSNTGEARASFDLGQYQAVHMVGVHTQTSNSLFIDGEMVAEVDITPEQQADTFAGDQVALGSGRSTSSNSLMLNAIAVYEGVLDQSTIMVHYEYGRAYVNAEHVSIGYGGDLLEFSASQTAPVIEEDYSLEEDWLMGGLFSVAVREGSLYPESEDGQTVAGRWEVAIPLDSEGLLYAGTLGWEGQGVTVETSRDKNSWFVAENGVNLSTIVSGTSTDDAILYVRVSFDAGAPEGAVYLDTLIFKLYASTLIPDFAGRKVLLDKASVEDLHEVKKYHENWGLELRGGSLTIKAPTGEEPVHPKTIEVWARKHQGTFADNLSTASPTTWRSNGGAGTAYRTGEWQLRHYVFNSGFSGDIVFSGTGQIGHVVLYPNVLSNDDIKSIYDSYMGSPKNIVPSSDVVNVFEFDGLVDISEYEWTIESSG